MTKKQAKERFIEECLAHVPEGDGPALSEAWNNWTDALCKEGEITEAQYASWTEPRFTMRDRLRALTP